MIFTKKLDQVNERLYAHLKSRAILFNVSKEFNVDIFQGVVITLDNDEVNTRVYLLYTQNIFLQFPIKTRTSLLYTHHLML
jgi:hypothetical protein